MKMNINSIRVLWTNQLFMIIIMNITMNKTNNQKNLYNISMIVLKPLKILMIKLQTILFKINQNTKIFIYKICKIIAKVLKININFKINIVQIK